MSQIIILDPAQKTKALYDDLLLIVADVAGLTVEDLSEEARGICAAFMNILTHSGVVGTTALGQPIFVHPAAVIEMAAKQARMRHKPEVVN